MKTRTKTNSKIKNWEKGKYYKIPENILKEVNEKWFFLYDWIDEKEIKTSIEIDFLEKIFILWPIVIIFMLLFAFATGLTGSLWFLLFFIILLMIYLLGLSIFKSLKASKINFLVITNNYFSVNEKIWKIENNSIFLDENIVNISKTFEEDLFSKSKLKETKKEKMKLVSIAKKILEFLWKISGDSRWNINFMALIVILLVAFALSMSIVYLIWIFIVMFFWIFTAFVNRKILIIKWNKILLINEYFEYLWNYSNNIKKQKTFLSDKLEKAIQNKWSNWLLLKINSGIEKINKTIKNAFIKNQDLIETIKNSKYNEIFDYKVYNSWLKKQIINPIKWVIELLEKNIKIIENQIWKIKNNIKAEKQEKLKVHLKVAKENLTIRKNDILKQKEIMQKLLEKLEI